MNENNEVIVKQKSNKGVIIVLIILLVGALGYIAYDKFISKDNKQAVNDTTSKGYTGNNISKIDNNKDYVYEAFNEKYKSNEGEESIILPKINLNSYDAERLNNKIIEEYQYAIDNCKKATKKGQICNTDINYKYYTSDEIISILVYYKHPEEDDAVTYTTYNINKTTGKEVSKYELLKKVGMSRDDYYFKLEESYETARPKEKAKEIMIDQVDDGLIMTELHLSSSNEVYLDNGELCVVFEEYYIIPANKFRILKVNSKKIIENSYELNNQ